jgi:hypothetical protein
VFFFSRLSVQRFWLPAQQKTASAALVAFLVRGGLRVKQRRCDILPLLQKYLIDLKGISILTNTSLDLRQFVWGTAPQDREFGGGCRSACAGWRAQQVAVPARLETAPSQFLAGPHDDSNRRRS